MTSWNPAAERILGYTPQEAIGQHIKLIIPRDRWDEEDEVLARIRRGERVDHFQTVRRTKSGRLLNISLTVSPIKDAQGNVVGASKIARDISDQLRAQEERERLLISEKKARESAQAQTRLHWHQPPHGVSLLKSTITMAKPGSSAFMMCPTELITETILMSKW